MNQAKDGHEIEKELKFVLSEIQHSNLVKFISTDGNVFEVDGQRFVVSGYQHKLRDYRDFDTPDYFLLENGASLTVRDRGNTYAVTSKFPAQQSDSRHEYTKPIESKVGRFSSFDVLAMSLEPINKVREITSKELVEVLQRNVSTHRANLHVTGSPVAELAVDKVSIRSIDDSKGKEFFELEIESKSSDCDLLLISSAIQRRFGSMSTTNYKSKYENSIRLLGR